MIVMILIENEALCIGFYWFEKEKLMIKNAKSDGFFPEARVIGCNLSDRFFCIHSNSLCEFQSNEIQVKKFQKNHGRQIASYKPRFSHPSVFLGHVSDKRYQSSNQGFK